MIDVIRIGLMGKVVVSCVVFKKIRILCGKGGVNIGCEIMVWDLWLCELDL